MSTKHRLRKLEDKTGVVSVETANKEAARMTDYERAQYIAMLPEATLRAIVARAVGIAPEELTHEQIDAAARGDYNA